MGGTPGAWYIGSFLCQGEGLKNINTCFFSLIEELNKLNDVNTMCMYFLNFTAFYGVIPSKLLRDVTFWH